ncbi:MAG TPA: hypothetical protein VK993_01265 [Chthoniobacterales bacterium]|nr:hypothetical protein [Chthoniobacterales bacterium]
MPWLTFVVPLRKTPLHHAQTRVGSNRAALGVFFIVPNSTAAAENCSKNLQTSTRRKAVPT